jgi:membrane protease YdiL (CAAX protease family)
MSTTAARLSEAAFIADLNPKERSLWRAAVTVIVGLVGGLIVGLVVGALALFAFVAASVSFGGGLTALRHAAGDLLSANGASLTSALVLLVLATATNAPLAVAFIGVAALLSGRRLLSYLTVAARFRWRLLLAGLLLSFMAVGPVVAIGQLLDPHAAPPPLLSLTPDLGGRILYAVAGFALLIPAAAAEEVVFRGWLLRQSAALTRNPLVLMALNGVLFSAVHGEFAPDPFLTRALMGAGFVYMTLRLGGVEFSIGAHAANNILIVLFLQPLTLRPAPSEGVSGESLLQDIYLFASYVAMTELMVRWTPLRRWSGVDPTAAPAATAVAAHFS